MPNYAFSDEQRARQRAAFGEVASEARPHYEWRLEDEVNEEFIRQEIERRLYQRRLPYGGNAEEHIVERLRALARQRDWGGRARAHFAAERWALVKGWYYKCKPLVPRSKATEQEFEWLTMLKQSAEMNNQPEYAWFADLMLAGLPNLVADFEVDCKFQIRKPDGVIVRYVQLRNVVGEASELVELPASSFAQPSHFREWLLERGGFTWKAGEKELQDLHEDVNRLSAWRTVNQVVAVGWHPTGGATRTPNGVLLQNGIWFMGDSAFAANGTELSPNDDSVYRLDGKSYILGNKGRELMKFLQEKPMMHPKVSYTSAVVDFSEPLIGAIPGMPTEEEFLRALFREMCKRFEDTVGGQDGHVLVGAMLSYLAAPEIFARYQAFPGVWLHGEASSGKSTLIGWMMSILGFKVHKGFGLLSNTSTVGLQCLLEQYSNLPVWLDEFRDFQVEPMKLGMIRSCCYRDEPAKFRVEREIRTAFIVSGETTTQDAATRGRFPHVLVARSRRRANHMQWFQAHEQYFSMITRYILRHREEFIGLVMSALERWMSVDLEGVDERGKLIHGISAAAWFGAVGLFQSHSSDEVTAFRHFMEGYCQTSAVDVKDEFNVNIFFREMVNMFQEDGPDVLKYFFTEPDGVLPNAPGSTTQRNWVKRQLWFWADPVISAVQAFLRKRGSSLPLKQKDLRDQLGRNPYWLGAESKWLRDCGHSAHCWGLDLDLTPLGYQQVADDDPAYVAFTDHRGSDPRLGPLYGIVHALEQRHRPQA